jgi:regulator of protease activity HflC (stomatin/prohibitin superfamily)
VTVAAFISRLFTALGYVLVIPLFFMAIKIIPEYKRGVMFRLGRLSGVCGPAAIQR